MPEGLSPQRKPIPPPRLPQGYKPPLPKRPDRILRTGALHLPPPDTAPPPRPPPRLTCTKAKNTAESSIRASSNSPTVQLSTSVDSTRLEAIVESPQLDEDSDAGDGIESSQIVSHSPSPHRCLSPRSPPKWPPPVPQKPKRLSIPNSSDMTSSSEITEAAVIGSNVPNTPLTFDNEMLKPLHPVATSSAGSSSGEYNHAFEDARSASPNLYTPLPSQPQSPGSAPPKPPRSQLLESKPSPPPHTPESKKSSESPTRYSTPSDILAESLQSSMNISSYSNEHQPYQISSPSKSVSPSLHSLGKQSSQPSISADLANDRTSSCSIEADEDGDNNNPHSDASLLSDSEAIPYYLRASKSPHSNSASISLLDKVVGDPLPTANIHPYFTQTAQMPITNSSTTHPAAYSNDLINFCDEGISVIAERDLSRNEQTTKQVDSNQFNQIRYQFSPMSSSTETHDEEESHYANLPLLNVASIEKYEANENSIVNDERRLSASSVFKSGIPQPPSSPPPVSVRPTEFGRELRNILDTSIELPDPAEQTSFGLEEGPNGGIWNPGYIGLESYRKLVEASQQYIPKKQPATETATNAPRMKSTGTVMSSNFAGRRSESDEAIDGVGTEEIVADGESICLSGYLHVMFNKKDRGKHWSVLRSNQLTFYANEDEVDEPLYGPYDLSTVTYVGRSAHSPSVINVYLKENAMCLHWNHLKLTTEDERAAYWVLLLAKCFMPNDDTVKYTVRNVDAAGRVWIRQGATCPWSKGWMHLYKRRLFYVLDNCAILFELDVRKFIAMKTDVAKVDWCASVIGSQKGPFLLTQDGSSLYVQSECDSITTLWCEVISNQMQCVGAKIEDHKLTADDIPIIVDKCIKYISTYGLYQPGLYRRNGSTVEARLLMDELKRGKFELYAYASQIFDLQFTYSDPINVHITPTSDEVVNVVADVLRSFFRHLESPLIPCYMQERLFAIAEIKDSSRLDEYHEVLMSLPRVRLQTLRRLLDHLKDVTEHANANLASIENIAQIFGPTIFAVDKYSNLMLAWLRYDGRTIESSSRPYTPLYDHLSGVTA
ncbi:unnamed protein product [Anisakis simplex]|uniref:Rho GTPase activating protein at 15B (inferred by orthology to a D. melanogaster protein) n=1 Tax=Anisakis simplex TaxID=6269 RepID=A0A0M3K6A1_ANISI|nr:unnamed protein product [Anisakis simplex]